MEFNFEALTYDELCGITKEHAITVRTVIDTIIDEIVSNYEPYQFEHDNEQGLNKGRVLKRFLETITDERDRHILYFAFDHIMEDCCERISKKRIKATLSKAFKEVLNELFEEEGSEKPKAPTTGL